MKKSKKKEVNLTGLRPGPTMPWIFPDGTAWIMQVVPKGDGSVCMEKIGECRKEDLDLEDWDDDLEE